MSGGPILVTGGNGQLATSLAAIGNGRVRRVGRPELDLADRDTIRRVFAAAAPGIVVNAAAHTAVDAAENEVAASEAANRDGPRVLAELCAAADIPLVHVSTDYVYDGSKGSPYVETDPTAPMGVYGRTPPTRARSCCERRGCSHPMAATSSRPC